MARPSDMYASVILSWMGVTVNAAAIEAHKAHIDAFLVVLRPLNRRKSSEKVTTLGQDEPDYQNTVYIPRDGQIGTAEVESEHAGC